MESGFGHNLEGFLIKGNLSLAPAEIPFLQGDGSIEGSGTLYFDVIREYNTHFGVNIQDVLFQNQSIRVPYTAPSTSLTSACIIVDGGISIRTTNNSTSVTSGGGLTLAGGMSVGKDAYIGGTLDVTGNKIRQLALPVIGTDAANKDYVDSVADRVSGDFTTGQVIFGASDGDAIKGYSFFRLGDDNLTLEKPLFLSNSATGGALVVDGKSVLDGSVDVNGNVNLNGNTLTGLSPPLGPTDATNKLYVDEIAASVANSVSGNFSAGQLLVADTTGNKIRGYPNLVYNGESLYLGSTVGTSLVVSGGTVIYQNLTVGGIINANLNTIQQVGYPINGTDAATKQYVDDLTAAKISGNFSTGQILIADTSGNTIRGYNLFTYTDNGSSGTLNIGGTVNVYNTQDAFGLNSGGALTVLGGASFQKSVFIGGQLDLNSQKITNVKTPEDPFDAVNKEYVDALFASGGGGGGGACGCGPDDTKYEREFLLENDITTPKDLTVFQFPTTTDAFVSYVLVTCEELSRSALYTLRGVNDGGDWKLSTSFIGGITGVNFYVYRGTVRYTNANTSGRFYIRFRTITDIVNPEDPGDIPVTQISESLLQNVVYSELSGTYSTTDSDALALVMFISSIDTDKYSLYFLNCTKRNGEWVLNYNQTGDRNDLSFRISGSTGTLSYLNTTGEDYLAKVTYTRLLNTQTTVTLDPTSTFTNAHTSQLRFDAGLTSFFLTLYVEIPSLSNLSSMFEITGFVDTSTSEWNINSRFTGNQTGVRFGIHTVGGVGYLQYTNTSGHIANLRYVKNFPVPLPTCRICKNLTVLGKLDMNGNPIVNVQYPVSRTDAANKEYVDDYFTQFTAGQIIVGGGSTRLRGYSELTYTAGTLRVGNASQLALDNTTDSTGLNGTTGSLITQGGAVFKKSVYIGGQLDLNLQKITSVSTPTEAFDAVNKAYVDAKFATCCGGHNEGELYYESSFELENGTLYLTDIPEFNFDGTVKAFVSYVYINQNVSGVASDSLVTIRGYTTGTEWIINKCFIGKKGGIDFSMRTAANGTGIMQYTNTNVSGTSMIKYRVMTQITDVAGTNQTNLMLTNGVEEYTYVPGLSFLSDTIDSVQIVMFVSNAIANKYALYFLNCVLKGDTWFLHCYFVGDNTGIFFRIKTNGSLGSIEYLNTSLDTEYIARIQSVQVLRKQNVSTLTLTPVGVPTIIDSTNLKLDKTILRHFQLMIYVEVPGIDKYAVYEIDGFVDTFYNEWKINTRFFGDRTGVTFYLNGEYLEYTNTNSVNANIRYILNVPTTYEPLQVRNGGTGNVYMEPYAVLRGNGTQPIIGTPDFIYQDYKLVLGNVSSIVLNNTQPAINLTTGTLVSSGGIVVNKNIIVGDSVTIRDTLFAPSAGDIFSERYFYADNDVTVPTNIQYFLFSDASIKSFKGTLCVTMTTIDDQYDTLFDIKGIKKRSGWIIVYDSIGDYTGINLTITSGGQVQYTSTNSSGWISTIMKFRAFTTTI